MKPVVEGQRQAQPRYARPGRRRHTPLHHSLRERSPSPSKMGRMFQESARQSLVERSLLVMDRGRQPITQLGEIARRQCRLFRPHRAVHGQQLV